MEVNSTSIQKLSLIFMKQPCWRIEPLAAELEYSVPSVRRFLSAIGYYSSYTHNGVWYTLGSIPRFDSDGAYSDEVGHLIRRKSATYSGEFGHPLRVRRWAQVNVSHVFDRVNVRQ